MSVRGAHHGADDPSLPERGAEGYVKFHAVHGVAPPPAHPNLDALDHARTILHDLGLVGMRADGIGFGNLSLRDDAGFVITGSGTGAPRVLGPGGYCRVLSFDLDSNSVTDEGPVPASSESMSHGAVYRGEPTVRCVIHVHSLALWRGLLDAGFPATRASAAYGTPEMARAILELVRRESRGRAKTGADAGAIPPSGILAMAGHEEGVIAYGPDIDSALAKLLSTEPISKPGWF